MGGALAEFGGNGKEGRRETVGRALVAVSDRLRGRDFKALSGRSCHALALTNQPEASLLGTADFKPTTCGITSLAAVRRY
jgi:hypothetical protein